jgi:hypothetical protein
VNKLPITRGIPYHSIIGDRGGGDTPNSSDGVVPYWSSHLDGAQSELIVNSDHGAPRYFHFNKHAACLFFFDRSFGDDNPPQQTADKTGQENRSILPWSFPGDFRARHNRHLFPCA